MGATNPSIGARTRGPKSLAIPISVCGYSHYNDDELLPGKFEFSFNPILSYQLSTQSGMFLH